MQLRTAGPRIPANDLELPQHPSLLQRPRQSLLQRAKAVLMVHTGMVGLLVCGGDKERDVQSTAAVLNEIGVGGLSVEVATDNEAALKSLVERGLAASSARGYHWRNISEARPQAKGIERAVCIMKEGIYANWLALERHCNARITGIYAPTSSLDGLRCVLAVSDLSLLTANVSVAFMHAPVEAEACDLVLLPANITIKGCRVIAWLGKAKEWAQASPLLWFLELQRVMFHGRSRHL